jgi:predicted dehydrogenase
VTTHRRSFLARSGLAALAAGTYARAAGANERVRLSMIGCGGMMGNHIAQALKSKDFEIVSLCEVDSDRLGKAAKTVEKSAGRSPKTEKDMRKVLNNDIDAVFIATPDHWHTPAAILALEAGKHVYVEKPCSHNIREGRLLVEAAAKAKKVVQVGTQTRSGEHAKSAAQALKEGLIGEVLVAKAWNSQRRRDIGKTKPSDPPANLDFDLWLGPAPRVPYRKNMLPGIWRWWYDFGAGDMGNDGVHDIDLARWGLGVTTHPHTVAAVGGKYFFDDDQQFPDTQYIVFEYQDDKAKRKKKQLIYEHRIWSPYVQEGHENGNAFYGTKGMLILGKGSGWVAYGERNKPIKQMKGSPDLPGHHANFVACIRDGKAPAASAEVGHLSAALCHLGNIACRVGRQLKFDPVKEVIVGDSEANALVKRKYREGHWAVPKGV